MRLPHYLTLSPSGVYHFRLRVPRHQQHAMGREVRLSLRTRERSAAQVAAQVLAQRYAPAFRAGSGRVDAKKLIEEAEAALRAGGALERYKISGPGFEIEANNAREHRQVVEALREARATITAQPAAAPLASAAEPDAQAQKKYRPAVLRNAARAYERTVLRHSDMPQKTLSAKLKAVTEFVGTMERLKPFPVLLNEVSRADVGDWIAELSQHNAPPTLRNKAGYVEAFFSWAQSKGIYLEGSNPAKGVAAYPKKEKKRREKARGFAKFTNAQISALFAPAALASLAPDARWGALLGLYTGARVSEIAQARLVDFAEKEGFLCLRITDEGADQSLKTDGSARIVPLHPDLLASGLRERLEALSAAGEVRFFGGHGTGTKINGAGDWLSKAWGRYLVKQNVRAEGTGRLGFHSFRSTLTQWLQDAKVPAERRAPLLGHELNDVHFSNYSREPTIPELVEVLESGIRPGLELPALRKLLLGET